MMTGQEFTPDIMIAFALGLECGHTYKVKSIDDKYVYLSEDKKIAVELIGSLKIKPNSPA